MTKKDKPRITLEVCVTTADEAVTAAEAGADRLELCTALELDGLTPSPGAFLDVKAAVPIPVVVLIRPRAGGFVYTPREFATCLRDIDWFLAHGAEGVVCGALNETGRLDRDRCRELVRSAGGRAVLHRAFDRLADLPGGLDEAIELGFERVLTSGGAASAVEGADAIRELVRRANGRIEVLPGAGIKPANVAALIRATGCEQVHGSFRGTVAAVRAELDRLAAG